MGECALFCLLLFLCARPATWAPLLQTTSRGPGDTTWTLSPKISGEFDPEHHERSFPPQRATVCPNKDPPTHALVRQPEEVSLENDNENENENANGHAAIQEGVVVVLRHHHHHHRRHSTLSSPSPRERVLIIITTIVVVMVNRRKMTTFCSSSHMGAKPAVVVARRRGARLRAGRPAQREG